MGPAEQSVAGFNVPAHLTTSVAIPAISLTCAPLQLLWLGHAGPGLYYQGPTKPLEEREMCTYASTLKGMPFCVL